MSEIFFAVYICADCQLLVRCPYLSARKACDVCVFRVFVCLCIQSGLFLPQSCCRSRVVWCRFFVLCYVVFFVLYCFRGCVLFFVVVIYYNVYVFFCIVCSLF